MLPENRLIRFVADPDGNIVPDVAAKLPGRGIWVEASRAAIAKAVEKKLFSRAAKAQVTATADLADRVEKALVTRMLGDLGLARRSGAAAAGLRQCAARPGKRQAAQGADRSHGRLRGRQAQTVRRRASAGTEMRGDREPDQRRIGLGLGRENVIHAAVQPGGLAERLIFDAERLSRLPHPTRPKEQHERYRRNQAPGQNAVAEEDGNLHRQAELQPWPHQGRGGGEEALRRAARRRQARAAPRPRRQARRRRRPRPRPKSPRAAPRGVVLRQLSDEEKARRATALADARVSDSEARKHRRRRRQAPRPAKKNC